MAEAGREREQAIVEIVCIAIVWWWMLGISKNYLLKIVQESVAHSNNRHWICELVRQRRPPQSFSFKLFGETDESKLYLLWRLRERLNLFWSVMEWTTHVSSPNMERNLLNCLPCIESMNIHCTLPYKSNVFPSIVKLLIQLLRFEILFQATQSDCNWLKINWLPFVHSIVVRISWWRRYIHPPSNETVDASRCALIQN